MASGESRTLGVAAVALLGFAGMMVWMLSGPDGEAGDEAQGEAEESPAADPAPSAKPSVTAAKPQPAQHEAAHDEPTPTKPPTDPMVDVFAGPMPDFMVDIQTRVLDKKWLDVTAQKALYDFGQEHKDDARPQLLLAWDSMNREWDGIGVRMYRIAYRADKRAKHDPRMLEDLISVASRFDKIEHTEATEVLVDAYGGSILPRIDEEIAKQRAAGQTRRVARLERVKAALQK